MMPKFRAWYKEEKCMAPVNDINFEKRIVNEHDVWRFFDEVILMQSTGLHDKNGIEIYEGDIVNVSTPYIDDLTNEVVEYCHTRAYYDVGSFMLGNFDTDKIEVIGNIHEHSHLLDNGGNL